MTKRHHLRRQAIVDIDRIADWIASDNPVAGDRFISVVNVACTNLIAMPGLGARFESDNPRLASWRVIQIPKFENYLLFYLETNGGIDVVRVVYGGMNLEAELGRS